MKSDQDYSAVGQNENSRKSQYTPLALVDGDELNNEAPHARRTYKANHCIDRVRNDGVRETECSSTLGNKDRLELLRTTKDIEVPKNRLNSYNSPKNKYGNRRTKAPYWWESDAHTRQTTHAIMSPKLTMKWRDNALQDSGLMDRLRSRRAQISLWQKFPNCIQKWRTLLVVIGSHKGSFARRASSEIVCSKAAME